MGKMIHCSVSKYTIVLYGSDGMLAAEFDTVSAMAKAIGCREDSVRRTISSNRNGHPRKIMWGDDLYEIYLLRK